MGAPKERRYCVFNQTCESFVGLNIRRADTPLARLRGMLGYFRIKSGEGLWLEPLCGLHTVGLLAPIDLIYLDSHNRVIRLVEHLSRFRIAPIRPKSASILGLPLHTIYSSQTNLGDQLLICRPEEMAEYVKKAVPGRDLEGKTENVNDAR